MLPLARPWLEFRSLFLVQVLEERGWWFGTLVFTSVFPLFLVFGLGRIGSAQAPQTLAYVITGSTVVSLTTSGVTMLAQTLGTIKERGDFLYYASLPIAKSSLLLALLASKLLFQLPGIVVALVGGSLLYHFPLAPDPFLLLILPLVALSLSGIGAALGILSPNDQATNVLSQLILFVVMFASPVFIAPDALPLPLRLFGLLLPPTYAADALRRAVVGQTDLRLALDLVVLAGCAAVSFTGVTLGLRWRLQ